MSYSKSIFAIAFLTIITSVSCVKKDPLAQISQVLMVPLSPDAAAVDFIINDLVQATTVNYSSTVGTAIYSFPYYTITPGNTKVTYNVSGTATTYATVTGPVDPETAYSTFLIDSVKRAKLVITKDDVSEPPEGKVKLRFLHFSHNAPAMDVSKSGGATLFTNRSFNDQVNNTAFQQFIVVDPGSYQFIFKTSGTTTTLYTTSTINLLPDRIYTLAARGIMGVTGNKGLGAWWYANRP
jgi:hypothetical protein